VRSPVRNMSLLGLLAEADPAFYFGGTLADGAAGARA
jgi:hypothetical protein